MGQIAGELGRALGPGAAQGRAVLVPDHRRAADRAGLRQEIGRRVRRTKGLVHLQNLGDDLSGLANFHGVADADVLLGDKVLVVEGGVGHRGPGQTDRRYHGLGRQHAGAAHLYHDIPDHGLLDLRRILKGRGPPGELGRAAQPLPGGQIVDLQNRAVDVEAVAVPVLADVGNPGLGLLGGGTEPVRDDLEPELPQIVQGFAVGLEGPALAELEVKDQNIQLAGSGDFRVQLPQGPGGGVAGIGERGPLPAPPGPR